MTRETTAPSMQRHDPIAAKLRLEGANAERDLIVEWLRHKEWWRESYACDMDARDLAEAIASGEHRLDRGRRT